MSEVTFLTDADKKHALAVSDSASDEKKVAKSETEKNGDGDSVNPNIVESCGQLFR